MTVKTSGSESHHPSASSEVSFAEIPFASRQLPGAKKITWIPLRRARTLRADSQSYQTEARRIPSWRATPGLIDPPRGHLVPEISTDSRDRETGLEERVSTRDRGDSAKVSSGTNVRANSTCSARLAPIELVCR